MEANQPQNEQTPVTGVRLSRRRFTRAGLSGTVILGSLSSKPVLGSSMNHCTVSGQVSGNLSRANVLATCDFGMSPAEWLAETDWPSPFVKGELPDKKCKLKSSIGPPPTVFNGYPAGESLNATFFCRSVGTGQAERCSLTLGSIGTSDKAATMHQVLAGMGSADLTSNFYLGGVVVASLLNAADPAIRYPVTAYTIIAMFNAVKGGGSYPVTDSKSWDRERVIQYLESLYAEQG